MEKNITFLFPGQGAQYVGMGNEFYKEFIVARHTFEEANDRLNYNLSQIVFEGPDDKLTETANSQVAIYVTSIALMRVLQQVQPAIQPTYTAGLSLGEYTALTAAGYLSFEEGLRLVQLRGQAMNEACLRNIGGMAVVLGLDADTIEETVHQVGLPNDLWAANFNCPGQTVISGTIKGIEAGALALMDKGAKRVMPLKVHGAFHSGLMLPAAKILEKAIEETKWQNSQMFVAMNTTGQLTNDLETIKKLLALQVTSPVRWEQSIKALEYQGTQAYIEIGCGKALSGFNKRIGTSGPTYSVEKTADLSKLEELFANRM